MSRWVGSALVAVVGLLSAEARGQMPWLVLERGAEGREPEARAVLAEVESALPSAVRDGLGTESVDVRFDDWRAQVGDCTTSGLWKVKRGRRERPRIELHASLLDSGTVAPCSRDRHTLAQAAVVHALARLHEARSARAVSSDPAFRYLMGFARVGTLPGIPRPLRSKNHLEERSPDPAEWESLEESVATNLELFSLDPEFACRRPAVEQYLSGRFGRGASVAGETCRLETRVWLQSQNPVLDHRLETRLDPERVFEAHYLFAAKAKRIMSRWGHAMIRLVVCAPERAVVGPDCRRDIRHHVVISYRANVQDLRISNWKGLTGRYPSQLFLLPYLEVVDEYTEEQLRELISLPLKLTGDELRMLVKGALEQYWEYRGRYYFVTNNCSTETLDFLRGIVRKEEFARESSWTPIGLYKDLIRTGVANATVLANRAEAIRGGYFVESKLPSLEKAYGALASILGAAPFGTLEAYLAGSSHDVRRSLHDRGSWSLDAAGRRRLAGFFYFLESYLDTIRNKERVEKVMGYYEKLKRQGSDEAGLLDRFDAFVRLHVVPHPVDRLQAGYGVPQPSDFRARSPEDPGRDPEALARLQREVQALIAKKFPSETGEILGITANRSHFRQRILE